MLKEMKQKDFSRESIKYFAMFTMLLNHIGNIFLGAESFLREFFIDIGYFTAITMCFFLVEGYHHTRSKKKYAGRLFLFALISQLPFSLAFAPFSGLNMMFTLFLCFLILMVLENVKNKVGRGALVVLLTFCTAFSDWAWMAPVFTILFYYAGTSKEKQKKAYLISCIYFGCIGLMQGMYFLSPIMCVVKTLGMLMGPVLSGICICRFYEGRRAKTGLTFSKWFFYLFYPVHLLLLGILHRVML